MVRMANVYLAEGSLENAYILYIKFMTLFLEKIRKHPEYTSVPPSVKAVNQAKLKEVMPKAEKLKQKLLDQYAKEHVIYQEEVSVQNLVTVINIPLNISIDLILFSLLLDINIKAAGSKTVLNGFLLNLLPLHF